jgi:hypothetical protein
LSALYAISPQKGLTNIANFGKIGCGNIVVMSASKNPMIIGQTNMSFG